MAAKIINHSSIFCKSPHWADDQGRPGQQTQKEKEEEECYTEYFPHMDGQFFVLFAVVVVFFANHFSWAAEKVEAEMRAYTTDMREELEPQGGKR